MMFLEKPLVFHICFGGRFQPPRATAATASASGQEPGSHNRAAFEEINGGFHCGFHGAFMGNTWEDHAKTLVM